MTNINRIERGARVRTQDSDLGEVYQVIVDPDTKELTHIVVSPTGESERVMIPASMVASADGGAVTLNTTLDNLRSMASQLRYNEAEFQPVDPNSVEGAPAQTAQGAQTIVEADSNTVQLGSQGGAPGYTSGVTSTPAYDTSASTGQMGPTGTGRQLKGSDLLGLKVLTFAEGDDLGKPKDILFDPEQNRIVALLMDEGGWFSSAKVIPWQSIRTIGHDSIIIPDQSSIVPASNDQYINRILDSDNQLKGTEVYTEDGRDLGAIQDLYFDDSTGELVGYEVSGGMFQSIARGRKFMPAPDTITVGQDAAFVPNEVGDAMQQQVGGLQGAAQSATSTATDALSTAREKVTSATADQQRSFVLGKPASSDVTDDSGRVLVPAGKTVDEGDVQKAEGAGKLNALFLAAGGGVAGGLLDTVRERASGLTEQASSMTAQQRDQQLNNAIGKTAGRDVYADDGTAIALQGTVVDYGAVERARAYGKENQLIAAVGAGSAQQTLTDAKEGIAGAFSGIRQRFEEMTQQQRESREEQRIKDALGRPVTRVILDQSDNVILETSQIVTNQAINQARAAGVLDILLDSVYDVEPDLSPEALHSGVPGQASLESQFERKRKPEDPIT